MAKLGDKSFRGFLCLFCLYSLSFNYVLSTALPANSGEITASANANLSAPTSGPTAASNPEANPPKGEKDGLETSDLISLILGIVTLGTTFLFSTAPALESYKNIKEMKDLQKLQAKAKEYAGQNSQQGNVQGAATVDNPSGKADGL